VASRPCAIMNVRSIAAAIATGVGLEAFAPPAATLCERFCPQQYARPLIAEHVEN